MDETTWVQILEIVGVIGGIATLLGFFLGPALWLGSKIDSFKQQVHDDMNEFRKEIKDFHGRLCDLEARRK